MKTVTVKQEESQMDTTETPETVAAPSKTRVYGATVAGAAVAVVLGIAANLIVGKASTKVTELINPPTVDTTNTEA
jgi:hypothetical protein